MTKDGEMAQREGSARAHSSKPALEKVHWVHWEQDHDARKKAIMEKHGDKVRALMVEDSQTLWWVTAMVLGQLFLSVRFSEGSWLSFFGWAYLGGTFLTHALFLAIHEVTHHTVFKKQWMNHAVAMWANIPIVVPYAMTFRDYHADHHRYLNWDGTDADVPTHLEMRLLDSFGGKFFFLAFQIFFYAFRPMFVKYKPLKTRHVVAIGVQGAFIALWLWLWGIWPLAFLIVSDLLAGTFSLTSGHFIAEHYNVYGAHVHQDTFSYYGVLNWLCYNVGYHNEHHDFPNIPWTRLPELRRIAAEFYDPLVQTESWFGTSMKFLFDPNVGLYSRTRRERGAAARKDLMKTDVEANPYLNKLLGDCKKCN